MTHESTPVTYGWWVVAHGYARTVWEYDAARLLNKQGEPVWAWYGDPENPDVVLEISPLEFGNVKVFWLDNHHRVTRSYLFVPADKSHRERHRGELILQKVTHHTYPAGDNSTFAQPETSSFALYWADGLRYYVQDLGKGPQPFIPSPVCWWGADDVRMFRRPAFGNHAEFLKVEHPAPPPMDGVPIDPDSVPEQYCDSPNCDHHKLPERRHYVWDDNDGAGLAVRRWRDIPLRRNRSEYYRLHRKVLEDKQTGQQAGALNADTTLLHEFMPRQGSGPEELAQLLVGVRFDTRQVHIMVMAQLAALPLADVTTFLDDIKTQFIAVPSPIQSMEDVPLWALDVDFFPLLCLYVPIQDAPIPAEVLRHAEKLDILVELFDPDITDDSVEN